MGGDMHGTHDHRLVAAQPKPAPPRGAHTRHCGSQPGTAVLSQYLDLLQSTCGLACGFKYIYKCAFTSSYELTAILVADIFAFF